MSVVLNSLYLHIDKKMNQIIKLIFLVSTAIMLMGTAEANCGSPFAPPCPGSYSCRGGPKGNTNSPYAPSCDSLSNSGGTSSGTRITSSCTPPYCGGTRAPYSGVPSSGGSSGGSGHLWGAPPILTPPTGSDSGQFGVCGTPTTPACDGTRPPVIISGGTVGAPGNGAISVINEVAGTIHTREKIYLGNNLSGVITISGGIITGQVEPTDPVKVFLVTTTNDSFFEIYPHPTVANTSEFLTERVIGLADALVDPLTYLNDVIYSVDLDNNVPSVSYELNALPSTEYYLLVHSSGNPDTNNIQYSFVTSKLPDDENTISICGTESTPSCGGNKPPEKIVSSIFSNTSVIAGDGSEVSHGVTSRERFFLGDNLNGLVRVTADLKNIDPNVVGGDGGQGDIEYFIVAARNDNFLMDKENEYCEGCPRNFQPSRYFSTNRDGYLDAYGDFPPGMRPLTNLIYAGDNTFSGVNGELNQYETGYLFKPVDFTFRALPELEYYLLVGGKSDAAWGMGVSGLADLNLEYIFNFSISAPTLSTSSWNEGEHEVLSGDFDNDGLLDLYLRSISLEKIVTLPYEIDINVRTVSGIGDLLLRNNGDGTYSIIYPIDPLIIKGTTWSEADYQLIYEDFDEDGLIDLRLEAQNISDTSIVLSTVNNGITPIIKQFIASTINQGIGPGSETGQSRPTTSRTSLDTSAGNSYSRSNNGLMVENTNGQFEVSSSGKPQYIIPVIPVPGIQNTTPNISMVYHGGSANNILGVGWYLQGLSKIERCQTTLVQDGNRNAVNFNSSDKFCINGQRLFVTNGIYGENNAEYRTENESYSKIVSYGQAGNGPQYFKVWKQNGDIEEYGNTASSIKLDQQSNNIFEWAISYKEDRETNYVNYSYYNNRTNGELYITRIDYTGNKSSSLSPKNSIRFEYVSRVDNTPSYSNGIKSSLGVRLEKIHAYQSTNWVKTYVIEYGSGQATNRSRIDNIRICVVGGCTPETKFDWDLGTEEVVFTEQSAQQDNTSYPSGALYENQQYHMADVNGDGRDDLIWTYRNGNDLGRVLYTANSIGTGFTKQDSDVDIGFNASIISADDQRFMIGDVNGDGKSDLVWVGRHLDDVYRVIYLANATGTGFTSQGYQVDSSLQYGFFEQGRYQLADVNGDGRSDIIWTFIYENKVGRVVYLADSDVASRVSFEKTSFIEDADFSPDAYNNHNFQSGDVNGDGKADLIWTFTFQDNLVQVLYLANANGTGFDKTSLQIDKDIFPTDTLYRDQKMLMGDVNADGKADLVWTYNYNNKLGRVVYLASAMGTSFVKKSSTLDNATALTPDTHLFNESRLADLNGDGRQDLVYTYTDSTTFGYQTYLSAVNGEGFIDGPSQEFSGAANSTYENQHYLLGDTNADGKTDLVWAYNDQFNTLARIAYTLPASHPDHIQKITDSFGHETIIDYRYLADNQNGFYTKGSSAQYPIRDDNGLSYLVERVQTGNAIGGYNTYNYAYVGAKTHLQGRGFLGFEQRIIIDQEKGFTTTETYHQTFPFIGLTQSEVVNKTSNGRAIEKIFNHWKSEDVTHTGRTTTFRYLKDSVVLKYERTGQAILAALNINTYDATTGNQTDNVMVTGKNISGGIDAAYNPQGTFTSSQISGTVKTITTAYDYINNTYDWSLGFVERKTVTFSAPGTIDQTVVSEFRPYSYNSFLTREEKQFVNSNTWITKTYSRDKFGNITDQTVTAADIVGSIPARLTHWGKYSDGMYPAFVNDAFGFRTTTSFNKRTGQLSREENVNSVVVDSVYDDFGRLVYQKQADSSDVRHKYTFCSNDCPANGVYYITTTHTHENQKSTNGSPISISIYDAFSREIRKQTIGFNGEYSFVDTEYDAQGRVNKVSQPYFAGNAVYETEYQYDDLGRVDLELPAAGGQISNSYSVDPTYGTRTTTTQTIVVPNGANKTITTVAKHDPNGLLRESIDGDNTVTSFTYNAQDAVETITVNNDATTGITITTDVAGNKTQLIDPDAGIINYKYNGVGELRQQTLDPGGLNHIITTSYDDLGRVVSTVYEDGTNPLTDNWVYDQEAYGFGLLSSKSSADFIERYRYDNYSRIKQTSTQILGEPTAKVIQQTYDAFSRPLETYYPSGLQIINQYRSTGYHSSTININTQQTYWKAANADAYGNITEENYANGLSTVKAYTPSTGKLESIQTGTAASPGNIQDISYVFDSIGNLLERSGNGVTESFAYDNVLRLNTATTSGLAGADRVISYAYDKLGNINTKSDVSDANGYYYAENGAGVHAVSRVVKGSTTTQYAYDAKGNMTNRGADIIDFTVFNKPSRISKPNTVTEFKYGPDQKRFYRRSENNGTVTETKHYAGGSYEEVTQGNTIREKTYVGDYLVHNAVRQLGSVASGENIRYIHRDHIGSTDAITNHAGEEITRMAFAPFGDRRQGNWENTTPEYADSLKVLTFENTTKGFTDHEHVDDFGLIHMNGRMYDPLIGRFISPDEYVQIPEFSQSYNRYSYVLNNPLTFKDESGEAAGLFVLIYQAIVQATTRVAIRQAPKVIKALDKVDSAVEKAQLVHDAATGNLSPTDALSIKTRRVKNKAAKANAVVPKASSNKAVKAGDKSAKGGSPGKSIGSKDGNTEGVGRKPIIVGENMKRVKQYAKENDGHAYKPWKNKDPFDYELGMKRNKQWINKQIKDGREVIDIGPDFKRRKAKGYNSDFYEMERKELKGYEKYQKIFEREGRNGGVNGIDF